MVVLVFEDKPKIVLKSSIHVLVSNQLYEKYFYIWIFYIFDCYDEHNARILLLKSLKVNNYA